VDDSEQNTEPKVEVKEEKPTGPVSVIVKRHGGYKEFLIDPKTKKFVKKPKKLPSSLEITRALRNLGNEHIVGPDGKILKDTNWMAAAKHMWRIAQGTAEGDPKQHAAAVLAFKEIGLRTAGKYATSEEDKEVLKSQGVRIVVVTAPEGLPLVEEQPKSVRKPAFLEGEVISTNPPAEGDSDAKKES
jgi:hypothetical protein